MSSRAAESDRNEALALAPDAARFLAPRVEREFTIWQLERTMPFNRAANASAAIGLAVAALVLGFLRVGVPYTVVGITACLAVWSVALGAAYRALGPGTWTWYAVGATNAAFGLGVVAVDVAYLDAVELSVAAACVVAFFGFTVSRTRPGVAASAAATYVLFDVAVLAGEMMGGRLGVMRGGLEIGVLFVAFVSGTRAALTIDREARRAYRQERTIEAQRETIAKQQALLEKELSHQVAERSRELGAVLAKSDVTLDVRALKAGERFAERYRIERALGAGGMGAVYEVERVTDGARLALKVVVGEVSGASAARFAREAEIGARVRHPNVVSIVDVGIASGVPYLAMELVRGGSLEAQRAKFGDVAWALPILRQIAEGLAALHDAGVVHRDLKPANVLLTETGAKISDFGVSRFGAIESESIDATGDTMAATPKKSAELTGTGVVMGTPLYMAPEGARSARALDASADVFALGIMACEMLTGRAPFAVPAFVLAMADQPIPAPASLDARVPDALRVAVLDALSADPARRPRSRAFLASSS